MSYFVVRKMPKNAVKCEVLLTIKTLRCNFDKIKTLITELHPYNVPEIIALPIVECSKEYLQWLIHETKQS